MNLPSSTSLRASLVYLYLIAFLSSCASIEEREAITGYYERNPVWRSWDGYESREISDNTFEIKVFGSSITPKERVEAIALMRAVDIAEDREFSRIMVLMVDDEVECRYGAGGLITAAPIHSLTVRLTDLQTDNGIATYSVASLKSELNSKLQSIELNIDQRREVRSAYMSQC